MFGMAGLGFRRPTEEEKKYGNFNRRMLAATLDFAIIGIVIAPLLDMFFGNVTIDFHALQAKMAASADEAERARIFREYIVESGALERWVENMSKQFSILFVLVAFCWHFWAATPGKMITRMKIVDAKTGEKISDTQILLRLAGYVISTLCFLIGFFWIGIDKRKQGWHDKFAGTVVKTIPWKKPTPDSKAADQ
ncbi:MAG: RDD family protein [Alphaproteobacteria bacterium]